MDLYKIVDPDGSCRNGGSGTWSLPDGDKPGEWWDIDGPLVACHNGLHLAARDQVPYWLGRSGGIVYRVETRGDIIDNGDKWVARSARLLPRHSSAPDPEPLRAKMETARIKRDRAVNRAAKRRNVSIPAVWRAYLVALGSSVKLPAGHPGKPYQDVRNTAEAAYHAAVVIADKPYGAALEAYEAAASLAVMPD